MSADYQWETLQSDGSHDLKPDAVTVVYIAFKPYGTRSLDAFMRSYRAHPAGFPHKLIIAYKGFADESDAGDFARLLSGQAHTAIFAPDGGYDIGTYAWVARRFPATFFCFLNTESVIVAPDWLKLLCRAAAIPSVGIAGATASYQSLLADHLAAHRQAPSPRNVRELVRWSPFNTWRHRLQYPPFPNPHLRTNAFVVRQDLWLELTRRSIRTRRDASRFENGTDNLTVRVNRRGLKVVVAGRDGKIFDLDEWPRSGTFWQGEQENLLVEDNQTRKFRLGNDAERMILANSAWGPGVFSGG